MVIKITPSHWLVAVPLLLLAIMPANAQTSLADLLDEETTSAGHRPEAVDAVPNGATDRAKSDLTRVPSGKAIQSSRAKVEEVFRDDFRAATTTEAKTALAMQLLKHASDTPQTADRYAMLIIAMEAAVAAGDLGTLTKVVEVICASYDVPRDKIKVECMQAFVANAPVAALGDASEMICRSAKQNLAKGQLAAARQWATLAINSARRARDRVQQKAAVDVLNEVRAREKAVAATKPLVDRLAADPNDRQASSELGRIRCFEEGDWETGLPLLVRGSDPELAQLAKLELRQGKSPVDHVRLGDSWLVYAETQKGDDAAAAEARCYYHYDIALDELSGLEKIRIQKRLSEARAAGSGAEKRPRSLVLWLDASGPGTLRSPQGRPCDAKRTPKMAVASWSDLGAGITLATAPNSGQPVFDATAIAGKPGVMFGGNERLVGKFSMPQAGSIAVVLEVAGLADMRAIGCMEKDPGIRLALRPDGGIWLEFAKNFVGGPMARAPKSSLVIGKPLIVTGFWSDSVGIRLNGGQFVSPANPAPDLSVGTAIVVGAMTEQGHYCFKGGIGEVRIYNEVLSPAAFIRLESDLQRKWLGRR